MLNYGKINTPCQPVSTFKKEVKCYDFNLLLGCMLSKTTGFWIRFDLSIFIKYHTSAASGLKNGQSDRKRNYAILA